MDIKILDTERKCAKCGKLADMGHVFNDKQELAGRTRLWEVFMCAVCLEPVLNGTNKKGE